jgi:hypothetical protein
MNIPFNDFPKMSISEKVYRHFALYNLIGGTTNFPFHPSNFANTNSPCPTDIPLFEKKRGKMQNTAMQKHQEGNLSYTHWPSSPPFSVASG